MKENVVCMLRIQQKIFYDISKTIPLSNWVDDSLLACEWKSNEFLYELQFYFVIYF
jgi:hypothetical protein